MPGSVVAVEFEARPEQLGILRAVTRTLGLGLGLVVNAAADLELTAHEIGAALIAVAAPGAMVRFEYREQATALAVRVSSRTVIAPVMDGLAWHIVRTLAADVTLDCGPYDARDAGHPVAVLFTWPRPLG